MQCSCRVICVSGLSAGLFDARLVPWELRIVNANAVLQQGYLQGYSMRIAKASVNGALQQGYVVAQQCLCKAAEQQQQQQQSALLYVLR